MHDAEKMVQGSKNQTTYRLSVGKITKDGLKREERVLESPLRMNNDSKIIFLKLDIFPLGSSFPGLFSNFEETSLHFK